MTSPNIRKKSSVCYDEDNKRRKSGLNEEESEKQEKKVNSDIL